MGDVMKVWVPIDLPEGYRVRDVVVEGGLGGPSHTRVLRPGLLVCEDEFLARTSAAAQLRARHEPPVPRERWEYAAMLRNGNTQGSFLLDCGGMGSQGWELVLAVPAHDPHRGQEFWFRRRL